MKKSWIANGVTAANALFGGLSIMCSINGEFYLAATFILLATVADALDGRVARALKTAGPFGVELDSLCDNISFGIAAGALIYSYQLQSLGTYGLGCTWILSRTSLSYGRSFDFIIRTFRSEDLGLACTYLCFRIGNSDGK